MWICVKCRFSRLPERSYIRHFPDTCIEWAGKQMTKIPCRFNELLSNYQLGHNTFYPK